MKYVKMSRTEFIREHQKLIRDLKYGNRKDQLRQASKQTKELKSYFRERK